jgi:hypothetical protein
MGNNSSKQEEQKQEEQKQEENNTTFSIITLTTHGLESVNEDKKVLVRTDVITSDRSKKKPIGYEGTIHTIHDYQTENETYDIKLPDNSINLAVPKKDITVTETTYIPSLFKIPESFRSFYKINLTSLQDCVTLDLDQVTSINNIIKETYSINKEDIIMFLSIVENQLDIQLNTIYGTRGIKYVTVIDCLKKNPTRQIVNKYLILEKDEEAEKKDGKYQDSGIFSLSDNNSLTDRDLFQEIWIHNNEGKAYDIKEQRDVTLKEFFQYITLFAPEIVDLVIVDTTCFGIGIGKAGISQVDQLALREDIDFNQRVRMNLYINKYPYGGKRKRRKTKRRKTKGKTQKVKHKR